MVVLKKIKSKKINYSYVLGRFSPEIGSKFQYFPIDNWQEDLKHAKKFKFDGTEWIISDFSNPIFNNNFRKIIKKELKKNKLKICSISLDLIMDNPLHLINKNDVEWLAKELKKVIDYFSITRVTIPIEERSRFNNYIEKKIALKNLKRFYTILSSRTKLSIETDMSPYSLKSLLNNKSFKKLGLLLDLGNTRSHGFFIEDFIKLFPNKIFGVHIKYRPLFYSKTSRLKSNYKELNVLIKNIHSLKNCKDITFQTFKSNNNFLNDMAFSIKNFNKHVQK